MLPKIEACIDFVNSSTNKKALITSLEKAKDALEGKTGTLIYNDWFVKRILNIMIIWIIFRILFMYKQGYIFNHLK